MLEASALKEELDARLRAPFRSRTATREDELTATSLDPYQSSVRGDH